MLYQVVVFIGGKMLNGADFIIIKLNVTNITFEFMRGVQDSSFRLSS